MSSEKATFGAGCFWGVEWVFMQVPGVTQVVSGYAGGHTADPTYQQVSSHTTGHAEVVQVTFDPDRVSYEQLLEVFWAMHDPTQVDCRFGARLRRGRSEEQRRAAEASMARAQQRFSHPIATQVVDLDVFYPAEGYHQQYYFKNGHQPYCHVLPVATLRDLRLIPQTA